MCLSNRKGPPHGYLRHDDLTRAFLLSVFPGTPDHRAAARDKVRVARSLESLPKISEAFRSGQVSYSKVRAPLRGQV